VVHHAVSQKLLYQFWLLLIERFFDEPPDDCFILFYGQGASSLARIARR
jgi:hypothetical protein